MNVVRISPHEVIDRPAFAGAGRAGLRAGMRVTQGHGNLDDETVTVA